MPACVAIMISTTPLRRRASAALEVALEQRGEGLLVLPFRVLRRERLDPVEGERKLEVHRLLGPQRAVVVERRRCVRRAARSRAASSSPFDEGDDRPAWRRRSTRAADRQPARGGEGSSATRWRASNDDPAHCCHLLAPRGATPRDAARLACCIPETLRLSACRCPGGLVTAPSRDRG